MCPITRFAPSPTGLLHAGNAFAALYCARWASEHDARLLLRIEDIDHTRCQPHFTDAIFEDLHWLGLRWEEPVRKQSEYTHAYQLAIETLREAGFIYPCFCTRKAIRAELDSMGVAPHSEDAALYYPGICRQLATTEQERRMLHEPFAWRLDVAKAVVQIGKAPGWHDVNGLLHPADLTHDVIIGRKDIAYSYHLAVVVDDAAQGITHVIRGEDLQSSTGIHRLLQTLLGLPEPAYLHHPLLKTPIGERLAKRIGSSTLRNLREAGVDPERLRHYLLYESHHVWPFIDSDQAAILASLGVCRT